MAKPGPKPIRYPVHGRMMTRREVAEEFGLAENNIFDWQKRHRHDDGTLATMEETWDHYDAVREGWKPRYPGRSPHVYCVNGEKLTVRDMAERSGISLTYFRVDMARAGLSPTEEYWRRQKLKARVAELRILRILKETQSNGT